MSSERSSPEYSLERLQKSNERYRALRRPIMLIYASMVSEAYHSYMAEDFPKEMHECNLYKHFMDRPMLFYENYPDMFRKFHQFCPRSYSVKKRNEAQKELMDFINADI